MVARVIVEVMPKPEILDPQGQAIQKALTRLGFDGVASVRQGKRFEIEIDSPASPAGPAGPADEATLAAVREMAERLLANTVIEDFVVRADAATATA
jgi:phosphoribosylformylglycinamidine synthase PurS subunit